MSDKKDEVQEAKDALAKAGGKVSGQLAEAAPDYVKSLADTANQPIEGDGTNE